MTPETVFIVCNYGVIPAWILLAVAPSWVWTQRVVHQIWVPMLLGVVYLGALAVSPPSPYGASFASLSGVMLLFSNPYFALAGWVHYLVFDLFIGAWQVRDARRRGIPHLYVLPCLFLTLMAGPIGLLAYITLRFGMRRAVDFEETGPGSV